jgi:phosphomannomutase/phosphoglucomutase
VVVDCGNAIAAKTAPPLLRALGCEVVELYCEVDGRFPHHHPDPSIPENLVDLQAAVREHQADIGLAFDGDADRLGVVTIPAKSSGRIAC